MKSIEQLTLQSRADEMERAARIAADHQDTVLAKELNHYALLLRTKVDLVKNDPKLRMHLAGLHRSA